MRFVIFIVVAFAGTASSVRAASPGGSGGRLGDKSPETLRHRLRGKTGFTVGKWAYRRLRKAQQLVSDEKYDAALDVLREMKTRESLNDHERALMWQTFAFVWSGKEQFAKAADSFEKCLALRALPEGGALNTLYNLGQMYMAAERFNKAIEAFVEWLKYAKKPTPSAQYLIAVAYAQAKRFRDALRHVKTANRARAKPPESWLQLQLSLHFELEQYAELAIVLKQLIPRFPKKTYWAQLSAVYAELGDQPRALAVLELAYGQNMLTKKDELLNLSRRYLSQGLPLKAAAVVERGLGSGIVSRNATSLRLLANGLLHAREYERAVEPLGGAASLSDDGALFVQLAHLHIEALLWNKAVDALESAHGKGGLRDPGNAYLLLGIANHALDQSGPARAAFDNARGFDKSKTAAQEWLKLMRQKR